jgi:hypothetical protein
MQLQKRDYVLAGTGAIAGVILGISSTFVALNGFNPSSTQNQIAPTPTVSQSSAGTITTTPTIILPSSSPEPTGTTVSEAIIKVALFNQTRFVNNQQDYIQDVTRKTTRKDVGTFAIEQIIAGPSASEKSLGFVPTFGTGTHVMFSGESSCNGKDFTLTISDDKVGIVKFCRQTMLSGDMSGGIVVSQITKTLKQFPTIKQVAVLNNRNSCFDDMKGGTTIKDCTQ